MPNIEKLYRRNRKFSTGFTQSDLPIVPKLRTVILTCVDARVDPAHVLGVELGDAVVIRNTGGRVTPEVINEVATLAFMVGKMDGDPPGVIEFVIMHHTQCGAERFADPQFQTAVKGALDIDVAHLAITDHQRSVLDDIELIRNDKRIPDHVVISGVIYDVKTGNVTEVAAPAQIR